MFAGLYDASQGKDEQMVLQRFRSQQTLNSAGITNDLFAALPRDRIFVVSTVVIAPASAVANVIDFSMFMRDANNNNPVLVAAWVRSAGGGGVVTSTLADLPINHDMLVIPPGYKLTYTQSFSVADATNTADVSVTGFLLPRGTLL